MSINESYINVWYNKILNHKHRILTNFDIIYIRTFLFYMLYIFIRLFKRIYLSKTLNQELLLYLLYMILFLHTSFYSLEQNSKHILFEFSRLFYTTRLCVLVCLGNDFHHNYVLPSPKFD